MSMLRRVRNSIRRTLLDFGNVERIHIVGAARSGTTLLQYAMGAFEHSVLHPVETNPVWQPTFKSSLGLAFSVFRRSTPVLYVTKRNYAWYEDEVIQEVADEIIEGNIGLVMLVRDPRDSLTSRHANHKHSEFYLDPKRWLQSVSAGQQLFEILRDHPKKIVIRYEDMVGYPGDTCSSLEECFGIRLDPRVNDWSQLASNLAMLNNVELSERRMIALHKVRDFDANSVGKWRHDPACLEHWKEITSNTELMPAISDFMARHGYT